MKEVEVKATLHDFNAVKQKLLNLGCTFSETLVQKDRIYLHRSVGFEDVTRGTVVLRIRDSNGKYTITLKKQLENELDNIEREITINDPKQGDDILRLMDFVEVVQVSKKRVKCKHNGLEICLDEVDGLGPFIEVEKMTPDEDSLQVQHELFEFLKSLGVKREDQVFKGYDTLIYEKSKHSKQ